MCPSQDLDKIVEREEEARTSKKVIRKITYKGEVEIEAERTEAIEVSATPVVQVETLCMGTHTHTHTHTHTAHSLQTIVAPSEEMAVTPSTPLTPTATKLTVQSFDGAKASDSGTKTTGKQDSQTDTKAKPASTTKQDGQKNKQSKDKQKPTNPSKSESTSTSELKATNDDVAKKDTDQAGQSGVLLDLLTDTTSEHGSHIYHPHCQICLGKKPAHPQTGSTKDEELVVYLHVSLIMCIVSMIIHVHVHVHVHVHCMYIHVHCMYIHVHCMYIHVHCMYIHVHIVCTYMYIVCTYMYIVCTYMYIQCIYMYMYCACLTA